MLKNLIGLLLISQVLISCSTFDRHIYYNVEADSDHVKQSYYGERCGSRPLQGLPEIYNSSIGEVSAKQFQEPYLWGPFIFAVIPVFPITYVVKAVVSKNIEIQISGPDLQQLPLKNYVINIADSETPIYPVEFSYYPGFIRLTFPIDYRDTEEFYFHILSSKEKILFKLGHRWVWHSYPLNGC